MMYTIVLDMMTILYLRCSAIQTVVINVYNMCSGHRCLDKAHPVLLFQYRFAELLLNEEA